MRAEEDDLFAAAVILFILLTQHPPFVKADKKDKYYKSLYKGKFDRFWKKHPDDEFSTDFKDLFEKMVSPNLEFRLSFDQIKDHPWYKGTVTSPKDIVMRFTDRRNTIIRMSREKIVKQTKKDESENPRKNTLIRNKEFKARTKFFNVEDADELINVVVECAAKKGFQFEKSIDYYWVKINEQKSQTQLAANVIENTKDGTMWLEFNGRSGNKAVFESLCGLFKSVCKVRFGYANELSKSNS